jgi:diamine N-acetyltransferase
MNKIIPWPPAMTGTYIYDTNAGLREKHVKNMKPVTRDSTVTLREVTKENLLVVALLDVGPGQDNLVAPNGFSIAQASFNANAWFRAVYADEQPVGFAMLDDWSLAPDQKPELFEEAYYVGLWRFMIDHRFQKFGFGAQAMRLLIAHARTRPGVKNMLLSFVPKENNPEPFYARFGFTRTGEVDDGEVVMRLSLD